MRGNYELERLTVGRIIYLLLLLLVMLTGCDSKVTEDYLVGGIWKEKVEYKDGEPVDEPSCIGYFTKGLEFQEDGIVYNEERNEEIGRASCRERVRRAHDGHGWSKY